MWVFGILEKFLKKQRGDPLKNFVPHRTDFDLVTLDMIMTLQTLQIQDLLMLLIIVHKLIQLYSTVDRI
jgi:hypothetical protein